MGYSRRGRRQLSELAPEARPSGGVEEIHEEGKEGKREIMGFIVRLLLILAFIGAICAVVVAILAVIWMSKKLLQKQK
jgi:hypothetical protein